MLLTEGPIFSSFASPITNPSVQKKGIYSMLRSTSKMINFLVCMNINEPDSDV
ncbi:MAG: hypothetical protein K1000chlam4_00495 [Chlamydiae bacterium]|nr:hypothetical protein [Chlamydiota bacterium]